MNRDIAFKANTRLFSWRRCKSAACLTVTLMIATNVMAQDQRADHTEPLWELGIGGFAAAGPDYPASGNYSANGLPLPLIIYRGDIFRLGDDALARVVPIETPDFSFGVSLDGSFAASGDDNALRDGLPELDALFEIGPEIVLAGPSVDLGLQVPAQVTFKLQARAVYAIDFEDFDATYEGYVIKPLAQLDAPAAFGPGSFASASIGPVFASEAVHDYFYEVDPAFARPDRPAFDADAGYLGAEISLAAGYEVNDRVSVFGGLRLALHEGAANDDSPLFEDEIGVSAFLGVSYAIFQSQRVVPQ